MNLYIPPDGWAYVKDLVVHFKRMADGGYSISWTLVVGTPEKRGK